MLQMLLDAEAIIGNILYRNSPIVGEDVTDLTNLRDRLHNCIVLNRNPVSPSCYGEDDCSTNQLSMCPWRMNCGSS